MLDNWNCLVCKQYNDILTNTCIACYQDKPHWLTCELQYIAEIKRGIFLQRISSLTALILGKENMTPQEELFAKFYNLEKVFVKDMDSVQLREQRDTLSKIAFEAKARLGAVDDEVRERDKKNPKNKEWLVTTDTSDLSTDAINAPKVRAARMSKMDKLRKELLAANIDEATVNEMIKNLERKATGDDASAITFKKPANPFNKPAVQTPVEVRIEEAKETGVITDTVAEPAKPNPFAKFKAS